MRNILIKAFSIFFFATFFFSSCITVRQTNFMQDIEKGYPKVKQEYYRVIPGDMLNITVYTLDKDVSQMFSEYLGIQQGEGSAGENSNSLEVRADGTINFPYVGKVYVLDMTLQEIGKLLSDKLSIYADGTTVSAYLANRYFSVLGQFGTGRIQMNTMSLTIYQALALSTNIGFYGDRSKVTILRQTKDGTILKTFDIRSKDVIDSEYYYIQPNDVLYVPTSNKRFFGAVTSFSGLVSMGFMIAGLVTLAVKLF